MDRVVSFLNANVTDRTVFLKWSVLFSKTECIPSEQGHTLYCFASSVPSKCLEPTKCLSMVVRSVTVTLEFLLKHWTESERTCFQSVV